MKTIQFFAAALLLVMAISCQKDGALTTLTDNPAIQHVNNETAAAPAPKVDLCHYDDENDTWHVISVSANAMQAHLNHGDVLLEDADGDGWVEAENECVPGGDCNDEDAAVNPGAEEVCGDGIDNNCDGEVDENCCCFEDVLSELEIASIQLPENGYPVYRIIFTNGALITMGAPPGEVGGGWGCQTNYVCHVCGPGTDNPDGCTFDDYCNTNTTPPITQAEYEACASVIIDLYNNSSREVKDAPKASDDTFCVSTK